MAPTTRITWGLRSPPAIAPTLTLQQVELMGLQVRLTQAEADYAQAEARVQLQRTLLAHWVSIFPSSSAPSLESLLACPSRTLMTSAPEDSNRGPYSPGGLQFPEFYLQKHNPRQPDMSPDLGLRAGDAIPLRGSASSATSPRCSSHASLGEEDDDAPVVLDRCRFWTVDEGCRQRMVRCKVAVGPGPGVFLPFLGVGDGTEDSSDCWRATVTVPPVLAFMNSLGILHLDGMTGTVATVRKALSFRRVSDTVEAQLTKP
ncbi:hypothetical protein E4U37_000210 [Claviceps purpurea]|nr:hypothetical protein E4U37_000210 [Claviceps purpurea]